ncbi:MAG: helix-turn-helix transcriptional regulator [Sterolibacterium sp.]|jgi:ribosome-binding protein aMBF1 (putative translation factor)
MNLQKIKSLNGKDEYVLLPVAVYEALKHEIQEKLARPKSKNADDGEYVPFVLEDYVDNPVALARMKAHLTQKQLADRMEVTQAYISKIERQDKVTPALLERASKAIRHSISVK